MTAQFTGERNTTGGQESFDHINASSVGTVSRTDFGNIATQLEEVAEVTGEISDGDINVAIAAALLGTTSF